MTEILELIDADKVIGEIYLITNIQDNKYYVGQTRSHHKNKGKYRPFGSIGRFNDHISEAVNNTKKKQCVYLNNAIRKYGKDKFKVDLLETCSLHDLNDREIHYISQYNSLYPNGYNLTKGGKNLPCDNDIVNDSELECPKKRGRNFGYTHKESTINKMKERLADPKILEPKKECMGSTMKSFYDNKKIDILSSYTLDDDVTKYIKPVREKNSDIIHDYIIRINGRKLTMGSKNDTLDKKYERLLNVLTKVKEKQNEEA